VGEFAEAIGAAAADPDAWSGMTRSVSNLEDYAGAPE